MRLIHIYITLMYHKKQIQSGFALMMALIVVSVVISVGLTLLDVSLKQIRLSTNSRDSETALHAASAGLECAQYWRFQNQTAMEAGSSMTAGCFGVAAATVVPTTIPTTGGGTAYMYEQEVTWGTGLATRCSSMKTLVLSSDLTSAATVNAMNTYFPGYPATSKTCPAGGRCTILSAMGYSRDCALRTEAGTVEREVLLEL